jgi:anti-sigma factor RsiW
VTETVVLAAPKSGAAVELLVEPLELELLELTELAELVEPLSTESVPEPPPPQAPRQKATDSSARRLMLRSPGRA